ncbi:hypothetical protein E2P81_ATG02629 [Venturia nashicola]|uniref:MARVEL domain-containing protein n=1 Tax=Venturia nashicola TaxID=86259 RepID=A0A4Z1P8U2_9PEZI|nr:hypothetical protein E6O75_ATG02693 [Venturia nashicola]TLD36847.1 hypothetical protein E2P81_ATG02629 [Venturia nashicola]
MSAVLVSSTWQKRVLFPIWGLRMALTSCLLTSFILTLDWISRQDSYTSSILAVAVFILVFLVAVLMIDVFSIVILARNRLFKSWFLGLQAALTMLWAMLLIMLVILATMIWQGTILTFGIFFVFIFISSLNITLWAMLIYRRARTTPATIKQYVEPIPGMVARNPDPFNDAYVLPPPPYTAAAIRYS